MKNILFSLTIRSSASISKLDKERDPSFNSERHLLKVLVEGEATLYLYEDQNLKRFFSI